jgi:carbonic anhydrase
MTTYEELFENNRKWIAEKKRTDSDFFRKLAVEQNPDYLYIGCSDSRVTAEEIMGVGPGEVFVHRNVANLVNSVDLNVLTVINYAVAQLDVKHIIVCGHYNCGGVRAAMQSKDLGIMNPWLRSIRDIYRLHREELDAITDEAKRYDRLVELNVQEQCLNVVKTAVVQLSYLANSRPEVHGWVFDIKNGHIVDLEIDFDRSLKQIMEIYDLTNSKS